MQPQRTRRARFARGTAIVVTIAAAILTRSETVGATCTMGVITGIHAGSFEAVNPSISGTGRYTVFHTQFGLIPTDINNQYDVYIVDRTTCALEVISVSSSEIATTNPSSYGTVSDDGNLVAFESNDVGLTVEAPGFTGPNAYLRNRSAGTTTRVSRNNAGNLGAGSRPKISGDGNVVAFLSSGNLVPEDTNGGTDTYVRDLVAGTTTRVSVATGNVQGTGGVGNNIRPGVSQDGRYIAFGSSHTNLVPGDTNNGPDSYWHDRQTGTTIRVSVGPAGQQASTFATSWDPDISGDGRYVVFGSNSTGWGGACNSGNIWVHDVQQSTTSLVAVSTTSSCNAIWPSISDDGRYVSFAGSAGFVIGDTNCCLDIMVTDRQLGVTRRVSTTVDGIQGNLGSPGDSAGIASISGDGQFVAFDTLANNLVPNDTNFQEDVVIVEWKFLSMPPNLDLMTNGNFTSGMNRWQTFATPDPSFIDSNITSGVFQFNRVPPPPGTTNQAVVLQSTHAQLQAFAAITATFQLGNSSTARRRISVLIHDANFSDLSVCTFWLPALTPLGNHTMKTHTTQAWFGATISFYAAEAGADGGFNRVDNVTLMYTPAEPDDETTCNDALKPTPPGGAASANFVTNGDFSAPFGPPWSTFGQITSQIAGGVFEYIRHGQDPAAVILQNTNQAVGQRQIITAGFALGNSSLVRKRVTVLLHEGDFSDLSACTFWVLPSVPVQGYVMRSYTTKPWVNATISIYAATVGPEQWIQLDNVSLATTPATATNGTDCYEPGSSGADEGLQVLAAARGSAAATIERPVRSRPAARAATSRAVSRNPGARVEAGGPTRLTATPDDENWLTLWLEPSDGDVLIQISVDGGEWTTVAIDSPSAEWRRIRLDVRDVPGQVIEVRAMRLRGPL